MKLRLLTPLTVSVVVIFQGGADAAPEHEAAMPASTEIRIVSNERIQFMGDTYSSEQMDVLLNAFDQQNQAAKSPPDFRAMLSVAPDVRTGFVELIADSLAERGYERIVLGMTDDTDAQTSETESWWEPLTHLQVELSPKSEPRMAITIRLSTDENAAFQQVYFGANPLGADVPHCFTRLNDQVAGLVGADGRLADELVFELESPPELPFRYTFAAFVAGAGRHTEDGEWMDRFIGTRRFSMPSDP